MSLLGGTQWYCATNLNLAGSNPDGTIEIFHGLNPLHRIMDLGSTQPLTVMITSDISWG
jgi:hypothetical protein